MPTWLNLSLLRSLSAVRPDPRTVSLRTELFLLGLILAVAAWLRFSTITMHSIWIDEGYTYAISKLPLQHLINVPFDVHPAPFFVLVHLFSPEAGDALSLRLPAAIASLASLIPIYILSRWLFGNVGALTVTALNATAYTNLVFANEARNYSLLMLLSVVLLLALLRFSRYRLAKGETVLRPAIFWAIAYTLACIAALYTHQIALIFIVCSNAAMWAMYSKNLQEMIANAGQLILVNVVVVIAWLPLLLRMASASYGLAWVEQPGPFLVAREIIAMIMPNKVGFLLMGAYSIVLVVGAVILYRAQYGLLFLVMAFIALLPGLIWIVGYISQPVFMSRAILPVLLGATIIIGAIPAYYRLTSFAAICTGAALFISALSGIQYLNRDLASPWVDNGQPQQDWRGVAGDLAGHGEQTILLCSPFALPSYSFYDPDTVLHISDREGGFWRMNEDDWRDLFGMPLSERGWHGLDPMAGMLLSKGREKVDAQSLSASYPTISLLVITFTAGWDCREEVIAQFDTAVGGAPVRHEYTGLERWDIQN